MGAARDILKQALELEPEERAELARGLLDSIPLPATPTPEPTVTPTPAPAFRPPAFVTPTPGR